MSIEILDSNKKRIALIIPASYEASGISFFTPNEYSQQLAYMNHPTDKVIPPHVHNKVDRQVFYTLEVLFVRKGRVRVDLYDDHRTYLESRILSTGDVIMLIAGGHGFKMLEPTEMIEVKQGPFVGEMDKTRFDRLDESLVRVVNS